MNAPFTILAAAMCSLLVGLPAALAFDGQDAWPVTDVFMHLGTGANGLAVSPPQLTLKAGELYRIVVINPSENDHIVAAPELASTGVTTSLLKGTPRVDYPASLINAGIAVRPGQLVEWTFMPLEAGTYTFGCDNPSHAAAEMDATIKVVREVL